jgi:hypothetical protein
LWREINYRLNNPAYLLKDVQWFFEPLTGPGRERRILDWMVANPGYHSVTDLLNEKVTVTREFTQIHQSCVQLTRRGFLRVRPHPTQGREFSFSGQGRRGVIEFDEPCLE